MRQRPLTRPLTTRLQYKNTQSNSESGCVIIDLRAVIAAPMARHIGNRGA